MRRKYWKDADWNDPRWTEKMQEFQQRRTRGKQFFGLAVALIGILWILKITFHVNIDWDRQWPFFMIIGGLLLGLKHNFRNSAWWILILIGLGNLAEIYSALQKEIIWAAVMVLVGLIIAFRPKNRPCKPQFKMDSSVTNENELNIDVVFGGRKEVVTSKDFKSGNISVAFGGCELNFMQADFESTAILDLRVSFGGIEIILPSHWMIQNEINTSFGNVEDERNFTTPGLNESKKVLILRGSCSFGNIELKSY